MPPFGCGGWGGSRREDHHHVLCLYAYVLLCLCSFLNCIISKKKKLYYFLLDQIFFKPEKYTLWSYLFSKNHFYSLCVVQNELLSRELIEKERDLERCRTVIGKFQNKCKCLLFLISDLYLYTFLNSCI